MPRSVLIAGSHRLLAGQLAVRYRRHTDATVVGDAESPVDEMWLLCGPRTDTAVTVPRLPRSALHLVIPAAGYQDLADTLAERCSAAGVAYRVVRTGDIVGDPVGSPALATDPRQGGCLGFLYTLLSVRREISERMPEYFQHEPLRCVVPAGALLDLVPVEAASEALFHLDGTGSHYELRAAAPVVVDRLTPVMTE